MCMGGTPDVPTPPERQMSKAPTDPVRDATRSDEQRRRGMLATILTSVVNPSAMATTSANAGGKPVLG